jgi:hypothetical protein
MGTPETSGITKKSLMKSKTYRAFQTHALRKKVVQKEALAKGYASEC